MIEPRSRGVLDPRLRGDDEILRGASCAQCPTHFPFFAPFFSIRFASTAQ